MTLKIKKVILTISKSLTNMLLVNTLFASIKVNYKILIFVFDDNTAGGRGDIDVFAGVCDMWSRSIECKR